MPIKDKEGHAAYMREYYKERPDQLERKRQRDKERYQENKERVLVYQREYYLANEQQIKARIKTTQKIQRDLRRREAIDKLGGKCMDCGLDNLIVLQFHHRPGTEKVAEVTSLANSFKKFWAEVDKCDLVCANCHLIRHNREVDGN